ncbi:GNAT family N-acetyltransferase [Candidatus Symbiopectobacterium sp. NZEC135]|uniref:GNAT family N-acetyltransferase n=1 Tax=Candidatus Symbiopectobacterium sp. NZEC135 TaxID=2820471 RepID=UPI0022277E8A|nr:GNAT family N-acetyltransferase [Candidatus Symbiopectobacterium sp. NZEC135]MCW2480400.1 GNAT family N-acetyltransferase [Candidatus Symbiopectobacterium sp. NZEC135]
MTFPSIRRLRTSDGLAFKQLRLESLLNHPDAYQASWEEESQESDAWFGARIRQNVIFGAFTSEAHLIGLCCYTRPQMLKSAHKGIVWGMYVTPAYRGKGISLQLLNHTISHARSRAHILLLSVTSSNLAAYRLYQKAGFCQYGQEPDAMKLGDIYYSERLMFLPLR